MSEERQILKDDELKTVVGGILSFNSRRGTLNYT